MFNVFVLSCSLSKATNKNYYIQCAYTVCCFSSVEQKLHSRITKGVLNCITVLYKPCAIFWVSSRPKLMFLFLKPLLFFFWCFFVLYSRNLLDWEAKCLLLMDSLTEEYIHFCFREGMGHMSMSPSCRVTRRWHQHGRRALPWGSSFPCW